MTSILRNKARLVRPAGLMLAAAACALVAAAAMAQQQKREPGRPLIQPMTPPGGAMLGRSDAVYDVPTIGSTPPTETVKVTIDKNPDCVLDIENAYTWLKTYTPLAEVGRTLKEAIDGLAKPAPANDSPACGVAGANAGPGCGLLGDTTETAHAIRADLSIALVRGRAAFDDLILKAYSKRVPSCTYCRIYDKAGRIAMLAGSDAVMRPERVDFGNAQLNAQYNAPNLREYHLKNLKAAQINNNDVLDRYIESIDALELGLGLPQPGNYKDDPGLCGADWEKSQKKVVNTAACNKDWMRANLSAHKNFMIFLLHSTQVTATDRNTLVQDWMIPDYRWASNYRNMCKPDGQYRFLQRFLIVVANQ